jgi:hypothetical protein
MLSLIKRRQIKIFSETLNESSQFTFIFRGIIGSGLIILAFIGHSAFAQSSRLFTTSGIEIADFGPEANSFDLAEARKSPDTSQMPDSNQIIQVGDQNSFSTHIPMTEVEVTYSNAIVDTNKPSLQNIDAIDENMIQNHIIDRANMPGYIDQSTEFHGNGPTWSNVKHLEMLFQAGGLIDLGETLYFLNNTEWIETNRFLGHHPSSAKLIAFKLSADALHFVLTKILFDIEPKYAKGFVIGSLVAQSGTVILNIRTLF